MNPVKNVIQHHMKKQNLTRSSLAKKLGYTSITGCLRKIDSFIEKPTFEHPLLLKLQEALYIPPQELTLAITQRHAYFEAENRKRFRPSLQTMVSRRPSPLFLAAVVPRLWNIPIGPEVQLLEYDDEIQAIIQKYQQLQLEHAKDLLVTEYCELVELLNEYDSKCAQYAWWFGRGFKYFRHYDETLVFDRDCVLQKISSAEQPDVARISI
jgi:hypothetical protein